VNSLIDHAGIREISEKLPNPRKLSTSLVNDEQSPDDEKSIAMAYWTIFVGHDISRTAIYKSGKIKQRCILIVINPCVRI